MGATIVVGGFFGDEGKGKIISYLAQKDNPSIVVRGGAGPNAGHTIKDGDKTFKVRMLPSGFLNKNSRKIIAARNYTHKEFNLRGLKSYNYFNNSVSADLKKK